MGRFQPNIGANRIVEKHSVSHYIKGLMISEGEVVLC